MWEQATNFKKRGNIFSFFFETTHFCLCWLNKDVCIVVSKMFALDDDATSHSHGQAYKHNLTQTDRQIFHKLKAKKRRLIFLKDLFFA